MKRRQYLSRAGAAIVVSASVAGCLGGSNGSDGGDDENSETTDGGDNGNSEMTDGGDDGGDVDLFGVAASGDGEKIPIDGAVDGNVVSGFEVVKHIGVVKEYGVVNVSARIENVGSETVGIAQQHSGRALLYGPDGQQLEEASDTTAQGQEFDGLPPGETGVLNFFPSNTYDPDDIDRYGIVLDCRDEPSREDARSPYCPEE